MSGEYTPTGLDIPIQGARWTRQFTFTDALTGDPNNLTGFTFDMQIRRYPEHSPPIASLTIGNGLYWVDQAGGILLVDISADWMATLPYSSPEGWWYDLRQYPTGNLAAATKPIRGRFPILAGVTR